MILPGRGRTRLPARATKERRRQAAADVETTLRELPGMGYSDLLEWYVADTKLTPDELHAAKKAGRLDELRTRRTDPPLLEVTREARVVVKDARVRHGLEALERLAPAGARFSWLMDRSAVRAMLEKREEEGVRRNSVRRSLYRAVAEVLAVRLPRARRLEVLRELEYAPEDDERRIHVTQADVRRLLDSIGDPLFLELVRTALTTGIDLGPLLRVRPRHLGADGRLQVFDRKTRARARTIWIPEPAQAAIRRAAMLTRAGDSPVWPWTARQAGARWAAAAETAGLAFEGYGRLRFKDLRAIFATAYLAGGGNVKNLMEIMGHTQLATTVRYVKRLPLDQSAEMAGAAEWLGVDRYLEVVG